MQLNINECYLNVLIIPRMTGINAYVFVLVGWSSEQDEHSRQVIIEEFFGQSGGTTSTIPSVSGHPVPPMEGPLYLKNDAKKGWKKIYCVLRPSG